MNGFRGRELAVASESAENFPRLKDLIILKAGKAGVGGVALVPWNAVDSNDFATAIRKEWFDALIGADTVLVALSTKGLKNNKWDLKSVFALCTGLGQECALLDFGFLLAHNIRELRERGLAVTGETPLLAFVDRRGAVAPLTAYLLGSFVDKLNASIDLDVPLTPHLLKNGIGEAAKEITDNPALISVLLHHKVVRLNGQKWAASHYSADRFRMVREVREKMVLKAYRRACAYGTVRAKAGGSGGRHE